ncbi:CaiB/BaiF CoA transferase family protein [Seohaeicola nanhaiensis]|uniref:CaiB/BaiF CoA transferase family protein n=1 Tax=Seohaeicola nanhaiensis TaxID=1387282 RepID=A0ABV9KKY2_9RHOB
MSTDNTAPALPCQGIRVLDLSRVLAGPFAGAILADLGADVIHVEHPDQMDETRRWPPVVGDFTGANAALNHSKRSIALDVGKPAGRDLLLRMIAESDVLIENFRHGGMDRLALGRETLKTANSRLIHCSVRAHPTKTRNERLPGYEATMQAYSGVMSLTGEADGDPVRCGPSVLDLSTGMASVVGILAALRHRDATGQGSYVEPSLLRSALNLMNFQIASYSLGGAVPQRYGSGHLSLVPYGTFHTKTGPILLAASNDRLYARLWSVLDRGRGEACPWPTLAERVQNRDLMNARLSVLTAEWDRDALREALEAEGVPSAPVQTLPEVLEDTSLVTAGALTRMQLPGGATLTIPGPLFGGDVPMKTRTVAPRLGENGPDILSEFGLTAEEVADYAAAGALPKV